MPTTNFWVTSTLAVVGVRVTCARPSYASVSQNAMLHWMDHLSHQGVVCEQEEGAEIPRPAHRGTALFSGHRVCGVCMQTERFDLHHAREMH